MWTIIHPTVPQKQLKSMLENTQRSADVLNTFSPRRREEEGGGGGPVHMSTYLTLDIHDWLLSPALSPPYFIQALPRPNLLVQ